MTARDSNRSRLPGFAVALALCLVAALALTGCLEQLQTTRLPGGALNNFFLHLQAGELDDARSYFAPGLVTPSATLDSSLQDASRKIRAYEIKDTKATGTDLPGGQKAETISGKVRKRTPAGQPAPLPETGWVQTDIISATLVERGPGWRLLDFKLECCGD